MTDLVDALRAASTATIAAAEEAAAVAKKEILTARRALRDAKAEADAAHRATLSAHGRQAARETEFAELSSRVEQAVFTDLPDAGQLVEQYLRAKQYIERLSRATARHEAYPVRTVGRSVLESEIALAKSELHLAECEHDALLYKLLLVTKEMALLNGSQIEISETQFANGRLAELRGEIGRLDREIRGLERKLLSHDETTTTLRERIND